MCYMRLSTRKSVTDTELAMMLSKKNSETLENFSENWRSKGAACGRTHVDVLCITGGGCQSDSAGADRVICNPGTMLSQFAYDDTDWAMMSSAPEWSPVTTLVLTHPVATCLCACDWRAYLTHGRCCCGTGGSGVGTLYGSLSGYLGGKVDSVICVCWKSSTPSHSCSSSFCWYLFRSKHPADFRGDWHGFLADMARIVRGQTLSLKRKEFIERHKLAVYRRRALLFATLCRSTRCGGGLCVASGAQHDPL